MENVLKYKQFTEAFTLSSDKIPEIGDIVDKIDFNDGDKIAFIDFGGVKNIPVQILDSEPEVVAANESNDPIGKFFGIEVKGDIITPNNKISKVLCKMAVKDGHFEDLGKGKFKLKK